MVLQMRENKIYCDECKDDIELPIAHMPASTSTKQIRINDKYNATIKIDGVREAVTGLNMCSEVLESVDLCKDCMDKLINIGIAKGLV